MELKIINSGTVRRIIHKIKFNSYHPATAMTRPSQYIQRITRLLHIRHIPPVHIQKNVKNRSYSAIDRAVLGSNKIYFNSSVQAPFILL